MRIFEIIETVQQKAKDKLVKMGVALPSFAEWVTLFKSKAWFSPYHFTGNDAFELPFNGRDYVYSPVIDYKIPAEAYNKNPIGHYKRGIKKYQTMIQKGKPLPPVTFVYDSYGNSWNLMDGNHRWSASVLEKCSTIRAIFAFPIKNLKDTG